MRYKPDCLLECKEEHEWRNSMELMLNLPSNSGVAQIFEVLEDDEKICVIIERAAGMHIVKCFASFPKIRQRLPDWEANHAKHFRDLTPQL